ncbi:MAG: hypothetical protein E7773_15175 [Sphingomonas sp.]|uniref:CC_3452 family protein n=1 Tax=Sphingomonas sp. TaxID=28214 RepID=UPI00121C83AE|nr:hypothetical protein [Sphingomonas sp.]THD34524.1 MAG: hypothetical protein E7773_15175 [Sphingomonas sp.]
MSRTLAFIGALAVTTVLGSTVALAQPLGSAGYYAATPVEAPAKTSIITRDTLWKFRDGAFTASKAAERDLILCQLVAQRVGKLSSFSAGGQALDADALAKCNAKAN